MTKISCERLMCKHNSHTKHITEKLVGELGTCKLEEITLMGQEECSERINRRNECNDEGKESLICKNFEQWRGNHGR